MSECKESGPPCARSAARIAMSRRGVLKLGLVSTFAPTVARAAERVWPDRPITIIAHFAPGGSNDLLARAVGAQISPRLNQPVVIENRAGANGNIGVAAAARAAPDGYTLIVASGSALVNPALMTVAYDLKKDFAPIAYLGSSPSTILTGVNSGISSFADLLAKAKAEPGSINYGTPGNGSTPHLTMELLQVRAGIKLTHVPYNGAAPAMLGVIGGTTQLACVNISGIVSNITAGSVRALAVTGREPWPELPDVPTLEAVGIRDAVAETSMFFLARAGTPASIVERLTREVFATMRGEEIKDRLLKAGFALSVEGSDDAGRRIDGELAFWADIVRQANLGTAK